MSLDRLQFRDIVERNQQFRDIASRTADPTTGVEYTDAGENGQVFVAVEWAPLNPPQTPPLPPPADPRAGANLDATVYDPLAYAIGQRSPLIYANAVNSPRPGANPEWGTFIVRPAVVGANLLLDHVRYLAVFGYMLLEGATNVEAPGFSLALEQALADFTDNRLLYEQTLLELHRLADLTTRAQPVILLAETWALTVRTLRNERVGPNSQLFSVLVAEAAGGAIGADGGGGGGPTGGGGPLSGMTINLPDLENEVNVEIVKQNLEAMQVVYFAWCLDDLRLFEVVDKLVESFNMGVLPVVRGRGGDLLYRYWKQSINRFTEIERRNLYARAFGAPGGEASVAMPNRDFSDLWLRFTSAVADWYHEEAVNPNPNGWGISQEPLRKAGRDLAANLSLYGYGVTFFAAIELQGQIRQMIDILQDSEVKGAYGARDMWQVVDQVAMLELGGARNSVRYRTLAQTGATVIRWLANSGNRLVDVNVGDVLTPNPPQRFGAAGVVVPRLLLNRRPRALAAANVAAQAPTDDQLINACVQWLAVTGTPSTRVAQYAEPVETPTVLSQPAPYSSLARDLAGDALLGAGINPAAVLN